MAIITKDILLTGVRRDDVFEWLGKPSNHDTIVAGAFDTASGNDGTYQLGITTPGRKRTMGYRFVSKDDEHGGRRILVETDGKRTRGKLNYSLRTMKPSTNTLVTIRMDYEPGGTLGGLINSTGLAEALESGLGRLLENISAACPRSA
jgi:hypothetical protein